MNDQARRALTEALRLAEHGYALTPVTITRAATGKKAARFHKGWRHESSWSTDPEVIRAWWVDHPDTSFAIGGGANGIEGVDLDVKPELGIDAVTDWASRGLPVSPFMQWTPSGGCHLIWRARTDGPTLPQEAGKTVGKGVDTRNRAGLFFAAGAYVLGEPGHYETEGGLPKLEDLPHTPHDVLDLFAHVPERAQRPLDGRIVTHDDTWQRAQAQAALTAIREHQRDEGGYRAKLQHAGLFLGRAVEQGFLTADAAEARIVEAHQCVWGPTVYAENLKDIRDALADGPRLERWRVPSPLPTVERPSALAGPVTVSASVTELPTDADLQADAWLSRPPAEEHDPAVDAAELADAIELRDLAGALGSVRMAKAVLSERARRAARRAEDASERPPRRIIREGLLNVSQLASIPAPRMLVAGVIPEDAVGYLGGRSGSYKTFVAVALAGALARGRAPAGFPEWVPARPVRVLYVAAEGPRGVASRIRADMLVNGGIPDGQLVMYPRPINLTDPEDVAELTEIAVEQGIGFVFVDTFGRASGATNDNDTGETRLVFNALAGLRDVHGIGGMFLDHTGHAGERLRGASGKGDDGDFVLMLGYRGDSRGSDVQRTLTVTKLKDEETEAAWPVRLQVVNVDGKPVGVAQTGEVGGGQGDTLAWGSAWHEVRRADLPPLVRDLKADDGGHRGVSAAQDIYRLLIEVNDPEGLTRARVASILKAECPRQHNPAQVEKAFPLLISRGILASEGKGGRVYVLDIPKA